MNECQTPEQREMLTLNSYSSSLTFSQVLQNLGIEEFGDQIFNANSRGELGHIYEYFHIFKTLEEKHRPLFAGTFKALVISIKDPSELKCFFQNPMYAISRLCEVAKKEQENETETN